ncbi:hypothetical protein NLU13_4389 [Sarocladium strictum]|uniref:Uncharacterized protein n=1 Tax=Sarocladium strictum TaxID=5046 RepID=A0AA39L8V1_SARSR|nr:hypothetical protein NLU13_4389 [Sarocladium strictum]
MASSRGGLDPDDVEPVAPHGQVALSPVIEDLLRTRYCIPHTTLLVEKLQITPVSRSGRWRAVMLLLGDGQLCIQAILGGGLHRFVETGQINVGAYVRLDDFMIRFRELEGDGEGNTEKVVYLAVEDLVTVGWNKSYQEARRKQVLEAEEELRKQNAPDPEEAELEYEGRAVDKAQQEQSYRPRKKQHIDESNDEDDEDDAFEDAPRASQDRALPARLPQPLSKGPSSSIKQDARSSSSIRSQLVAMPRDWHDPQTPLKLTTLRNIPLLPYAQNWTCNVLAIITSLSEVETSHLPPYRQRIARIADPSTTKRVHLTVFLNPEEFNPKIGSSVLLVGVKNHRFDGGSLKKYVSDTVPAQWWFENPWDLGWCDVQGLTEWWADVESRQNS